MKAAVLIGALLSAMLASVLLKLRNNKYRAMCADEDLDGIPDVYEQDDPAYHLRMAAIHEAKAAAHRRLAEAARAGGGDGDRDGERG